MHISTIHAYCQHVLTRMDARYRQFDVLDDNGLALYIMSRYGQLGLHEGLRDRAAGYFDLIKQVRNAWKIVNDEMVDIADVTAQDPELGRVLSDLRLILDRDEFIDFSLMIRLVVEGLEAGDPETLRTIGELRHLMVDEYQDVNPAQERLIQALHARSDTLFVVGDDDQSIYGWRGADVSRILTFEDRYPDCHRHTLSTNFRSTPPIVTAADGFAAAELGARRIAKDPEAARADEPRDFRRLWFRSRHDEAAWVADRIAALLGTEFREESGRVRGLTPGDFAILMRSTATPERDNSPRHAAFTRQLAERNILYSLEAGGGIFRRPLGETMRSGFELLRSRQPTRDEVRAFFEEEVLPVFPHADFETTAGVFAAWGRAIHLPDAGVRQRVYPQKLVHDLLSAFRLAEMDLSAVEMRDLGLFSRMIKDVESVYMSIDTAARFGSVANFLQHIAPDGYDTATDDLVQRPDAVTVSTVHKMKGLEFPVVFVVDVERQRFPRNRSAYSGWVPQEIIGDALNRGAYQGTAEEEARLFYTAVTRSERYLYVTGSENLPGGRKVWRPSPFAQRLQHDELSDDQEGLPDGLRAHPPARRLDETVLPTSYSDIRYYLRCGRDYQFRKIHGFSPPIPELFGFGMAVHAAVGKLHERFRRRAPTAEEGEAIARELFHLKHVAPSSDPENRPGPYERAQDSAAQMTTAYVAEYSEDFVRSRQVEAIFEIPVQGAVIAGSIDLLLNEDQNGKILDASVIDFKAMRGGDQPEEEEELHWTELAIQVQLYALAARDVLGQDARTGSVHLLKDSQRVQVPVSDEAVQAAVQNVEWAVERILAGDFPMRPHPKKCEACDFSALCPQRPQEFLTEEIPPPLHIPGGAGVDLARVFSQFQDDRIE